ncbi:MAG: hypothetical protein ACRCZD_17780 [Phycicoccus sp.]
MTDNNTKPEADDTPTPADVAKVVDQEVDKPKRTRRTKEQIAADEAATSDTSSPWDDLLAQVGEELDNQLVRWGVQDHPLVGGGDWAGRNVAEYRRNEATLQEQNAGRAQMGTMGWDTILQEEVFEALSESNPEKAVAELIQVAAVAVAAADSLRRNDVGVDV